MELNAFKKASKSLKQNQQYKVWQDGYHAEIAYSNRFIKQKMDHIHINPVVDWIVEYPDYLFSSARNYAGLDHELEVVVVFMG